MLDRDFLVDLHRGIERARQGHVFHDRNVVQLGDFPDLERDVVDTLGDADRRRHAAVVGQRHGIVGRVGDDHAGLGNRGHHALLGLLHPQLPDPALDVGVAFGLLVLVLDLLQRHLLPLVPLPVLEEIVGDRDRGQHRHHSAHHLQRQIGGDVQDDVGVEPQERLQTKALRPQHGHHDGAERDQLENALDEIRRRLLAEDALESGPGRHLAELRRQRFRRPHQPVLDHVARDRRNHQHQERHADGAEYRRAKQVGE